MYFCHIMIYLILAIVFSTGVFVAMRLFERFKLDNHQALMWNYVFASITGFVVSAGFAPSETAFTIGFALNT